MVVLTSWWPKSSWTVRMSCPSSSRWVAKEWRKVWQLTRLAIPARRVATPDRALQNRFVQIMAATLAGLSLHVNAGGRKDPLRGPFAPRAGVLPRDGSRQLDP